MVYTEGPGPKPNPLSSSNSGAYVEMRDEKGSWEQGERNGEQTPI